VSGMERSVVIGWVLAELCLGIGAVAAQQPAAPASMPAQDGVYNNSVRYARGQSIQPVFEGWEKNPDGTFSMWFGYLNRNYEERLNIPVGPNNGFNGEDMGQTEVFEPRRSRFAFKVVVPANFPKDRDLVWTVIANGVTQKAYGSLWPVWEVDQGTISANRGSRTAIDFDEPPNAPPRVINPPAKQTAEAGRSLEITLTVDDDGNPRPRVDRGASVAGLKGRPAERPLNDALRVSWVQWRGPGVAKFDPRVIRVADGKATTKVTFDKPGTYVLRAYAEDASIHTPQDVTVVVTTSTSDRQPQQ